MTWNQFGVTIADPEQVVLESDPYTPALLHLAHDHAGARGARRWVDEDASRRLAAEPRSKVTFAIEPQARAWSSSP